VTEEPPRQRRGPWPEPIVAERRRNRPLIPEHSHRQARWPVIILAATQILLTIAVVFLVFYVVDLAQYRAEETDRIEREVRSSVCDVLDRLTAGERLDPVREEYGCGSGLPPAPPPPP
jgi:hypothetical protein